MTTMHSNDRRGGIAAATTRDRPPAARKAGFAAFGALLGAIASASCCVVPLALFSLGVGGAWIGNLVALAPYQPYFVAATLVFLGAGLVMVYRRPKAAVGADGTFCARPVAGRITKTALWLSTVLVAAAAAFPYVAPLLLDA